MSRMFKKLYRNQQGFSLVELLIVIGIIGILSTIVIMNMRGSERGAMESKLKANVALLRESLVAYHADHGWFPCTATDWNSAGNEARFIQQLTWFSSETGQASQTRSTTYRFGPYLQEYPENPFYEGAATLAKATIIDMTNDRTLDAFQQAVANGTGNNGWYYEAKSGNITPNLGGGTFPDQYCYF
jgi:prepilin-type N-terminal cleavage/methylation domain-containing protein